jgi:hypothetical protein
MKTSLLLLLLLVAFTTTFGPLAGSAGPCLSQWQRCHDVCESHGGTDACADRCDVQYDACTSQPGGTVDPSCPVWLCPPYGF